MTKRLSTSATQEFATSAAHKRLRGHALQKALVDSSVPGSSSQPPRHERESVLANKLLSLWSHGLMSAKLVRELAHLAILDGAAHPDLWLVAKCGDYGESDGNISKSLVSAFCKAVDIADPITVEVPCVDPKKIQLNQLQLHCSCPTRGSRLCTMSSQTSSIHCLLQKTWKSFGLDPRRLATIDFEPTQ